MFVSKLNRIEACARRCIRSNDNLNRPPCTRSASTSKSTSFPGDHHSDDSGAWLEHATCKNSSQVRTKSTTERKSSQKRREAGERLPRTTTSGETQSSELFVTRSSEMVKSSKIELANKHSSESACSGGDRSSTAMIMSKLTRRFKLSDSSYRKLFVLFFKLLFHSIRYPCHPREFVDSKIVPLSSPASEKRLYCMFTPGRARLLPVIVLFFTLTTLRNFYYFRQISQLNFINLADNLWPVEGVEMSYQFVCLRTNCRRLSNESTIDDLDEMATELIHLPIFAICNPQIIWLYNPMFNFYSKFKSIGQIHGFMYYTAVTFCTVVLCIALPIYQITRMTSDASVMSIMCPKTQTKIDLEEVSELSRRFSNSLINSISAVDWGRFSQMPIEIQLITRRRSKFGESRKLNPMKEFRLIDANRDESTYLFDCLSINSTDWARNKWCHAMVTANSICILVCLFFIITFYLVAQKVLLNDQLDRSSRMLEFASGEANCSIWLQDKANVSANGEGQSMGDFELIKLIIEQARYWTVFQVIVETLTVLVLTVLVSFPSWAFYHGMNQLKLCIIELVFQVQIANEYAKFLLDGYKDRDSILTSLNSPSLLSIREESSTNLMHFSNVRRQQMKRPPNDGVRFRMSSIRDKLIDRIEFNSLYLTMKSIANESQRNDGSWSGDKLRSRIEIQDFAIDLISDFGLTPDVYAELSEKLTINYWTLTNLFKCHNSRVLNVLIFAYLFNYGLSALAVYLYRVARVSSTVALLLTGCSLTILNGLISAASNVHVCANRLKFAIWSLVALNTHLVEPRVIHSRIIWVKNLSRLSDSNGDSLAIKAMGFKVTHVGIIELLFWTATILLLAYTR